MSAAPLPQVPVVEAFFSSMAPRSTIAPHSDGCNFVRAAPRGTASSLRRPPTSPRCRVQVLTAHLGLVVPEGCELNVGGERRPWADGKAMLFDTSILHEATRTHTRTHTHAHTTHQCSPPPATPPHPPAATLLLPAAQARNDADSTRYVLMLRVYHPGLSALERKAMQLVFDTLDEPVPPTARDTCLPAALPDASLTRPQELLADPAALREYDARRRALEAASRAPWEQALAAGKRKGAKGGKAKGRRR